MTAYRAGGITKEKRPSKIKPIIKRWNIDKLYDEVEKYIVQISKEDYFCAEVIAEKLQAKKDLVVQILAKMNREGKVGQKENIPPHDSPRNKWFPSHHMDWIASKYRRL